MDNRDYQKLFLENSDSVYAYLTPDFKIVEETISSHEHISSEMSDRYRKGTCCYRDYMHRDAPCEDCVMKKAIVSGHREVHVYETPDGCYVLETTVTPIYDESKILDGVILSFHDITDLIRNKKLLEKTKEELEKMRALTSLSIHQSSIYVWEFDIEKGLFTHIDDYLMTLRGRKLGDLTDLEQFLSLVYPDDRKGFREAFTDLVETGGPCSYDCRVNVEDKNLQIYKWYRYRGIRTEIDNRMMLVGTTMCIEQYVQERLTMNSLMEQTEAVARDKFAFLANMSHDIRTPINAILGFAQILAETDDHDEQVEYSKIIKNNGEQLLGMLNDILDLSKLEAGKMAEKSQEVDLVPYFKELCMSLGRLLKNPDVKFVFDVPYTSMVAQLDKNHFARVLTNYITNAFKYTESGLVSAGLEKKGNGIRMYVTDTGIGIPEEKKCRVFSRFEKLDSYANGHGLGLSIVKTLVESVGGNVGFESEVGKGSTFWAWKPCAVTIC